MLILILISAGLVGLAAVLAIGQASASGVRVAPVAPAADQRGITLQTLIVTAVLVLMAVAAGVVIVAITNSASDDLERANAGIESQCNEVEVFDPVLAARGEKGRAGTEAAGVDGSDEGCIPVCVWTAVKKSGGTAADTISPGELEFVRNFETALVGGDTLKENDIRVFTSPTDLRGATDTVTVNDMSFEDAGGFKGKTIGSVRAIPSRDVCGVYNDEGRLIWPA